VLSARRVIYTQRQASLVATRRDPWGTRLMVGCEQVVFLPQHSCMTASRWSRVAHVQLTTSFYEIVSFL